MELGLTHHEAAVVRGVPGRDVRRPDHDPGGEAAHDEAEEELGERQAGAQDVALYHGRQELAGNCNKEINHTAHASHTHIGFGRINSHCRNFLASNRHFERAWSFVTEKRKISQLD